MSLPACFKAYDVRGRVPADLDESLARRIGRAVADRLGGRKYAVGRASANPAPPWPPRWPAG